MALKKWFIYSVTVMILNIIYNFFDFPFIVEFILGGVIFGTVIFFVETHEFKKRKNDK